MQTKILLRSRKLQILALALATLAISVFVVHAQSDGGGSKKITIKPRETATKTPAVTPKTAKDSAGAAKTPAGATTEGAKIAAEQKPAAEAGSDGSEGSFVDGLVGFIRARAAWILTGLGLLLVVVLLWAYLSSRGKSAKAEDPFEELGLGEKTAKPSSSMSSSKFSSTKIQASDVNSRISGSMKTTEVETDREYALVVDEEALKMPPLPEDAASPDAQVSRVAEAAHIQKLLESKRLDEAYAEYSRQIEGHASTAFQGDVERKLADHLIRAQELAKASTVLEHYVATQSKGEVQPDAYFNLGYIHFQRKSLGKSRRFLTLFVEHEKNPAYIARAKKILSRIQSSPTRN